MHQGLFVSLFNYSPHTDLHSVTISHLLNNSITTIKTYTEVDVDYNIVYCYQSRITLKFILLLEIKSLKDACINIKTTLISLILASVLFYLAN